MCLYNKDSDSKHNFVFQLARQLKYNYITRRRSHVSFGLLLLSKLVKVFTISSISSFIANKTKHYKSLSRTTFHLLKCSKHCAGEFGCYPNSQHFKGRNIPWIVHHDTHLQSPIMCLHHERKRVQKDPHRHEKKILH